MKIGFCTNLLNRSSQGVGDEWLAAGKSAGFDYVELPLTQVNALGSREFADLNAKLGDMGLPCEACNNFFPPEIRLTGDSFSLERIRTYLGEALVRAAALGVGIIVLGSPKSKNLEPGFPLATAKNQLVSSLQAISDLASPLGITVVLEPLAKEEANFINTGSEALDIVDLVGRHNVMVLIDFYHLSVEGENPEIVTKASDRLRHVHISDPPERLYPVNPKPGLEAFLRKLASVGYRHRISIEAFSESFSKDAELGLGALRRLIGSMQPDSNLS